MNSATTFGELLEAADRLTLEDQEALVEVLQRRLIEHRRAALAREIEEVRREFQAGGCRPVTAQELMDEILV